MCIELYGFMFNNKRSFFSVAIKNIMEHGILIFFFLYY